MQASALRADYFPKMTGAQTNRHLQGTSSVLIAGYLLTMGIQFEMSNFGRLAPSDVFLGLYTLLFWQRIRFVKESWTVFHYGLLLIFTIGTALSVAKYGLITNYVLINKDVGLVLLFLEYAVFTSLAEDWEHLRWVQKWYIHGVAIQCAIALAGYLAWKLTGFSQNWLNYGNARISGMLVDPNAFGGYVGTAFVVHGCTYFSRRPVIPGWLGTVYSVVLAMALLLTLSRSAWIGFVFALLITVPFRPKMAFAYAGTIMVTVLLIVLLLGDRVDSIVSVADRRNTAQQRVDQIMAALPMIAESPILGKGLAVFKETHGVILHNTTVWILVDFGLVGLTIYLGFLGWYFVRGYFGFKVLDGENGPLLLGLVAAHGCMLGVSAGIEALYQRHWWLTFAMIAAGAALALRRNQPVNRGTMRVFRGVPA